MEHKGDVSDQASDAEERFKKLALDVQAAKTNQPPPAHFDGSNCADCDGEIPEARLQLKYWRCTECQTSVEKKAKLRGY